MDVVARAPRSARRACRPSSRRRCASSRRATIPGLITTRSSVPAITPAPSAPRIRGFGTDGRPLRIQTSRWLSDAARSSIEHLAVGRLRIGDVLVAQHLGAAVLVDADRLHGAQSSHDDAPTSERLGEELGLDARRRRPRGGVRGDRAAHPRAPRARAVRGHEVHDGAARGRRAIRRRCSPARARVVSAALCYWQPEAPLAPGEGRLARYTWDDALRASCASSSTRSAGASAAPTACSSTRTSTSTARRPRASGVGFYGKNTMLITRRHGSWVVLGTLVTRRRARADAAARRRLRRLPALHRRVPDRRARRAGHARRDEVPLLLDAGARRRCPEPYRAELGAQVYGCDICQDVCPWNRGVEKRRAARAVERDGHVDLVAWLEADGARARRRRTSASTSRATTRAGCGATRSSRSATSAAPSTRRCSSASRERRRRAARRARAWALARVEERAREGSPAFARVVDRRRPPRARCRSRVLQVVAHDGLSDRATSAVAWALVGDPRRRRGGAVRAAVGDGTSRVCAASRWSSTSRSSRRVRRPLRVRARDADAAAAADRRRRRRDPLRHASAAS